MINKEAFSRIKINKLLEKSGWSFFDTDTGLANIQLEPNVKITINDLDSFGNDFEASKKGFVDFLLLDKKGFPLVVLEAKRESINPLDAKEQARKYAKSLNVRFIILSNGNLHYFWDLEHGNPEIIIEFPSPESLNNRKKFLPDKKRLYNENVTEQYIAITQKPGFNEEPDFKDISKREKYIKEQNIRILRPYQIKAIKALQIQAKEGNSRFLFEMATGTGKTLVSAAVIKLFLKTGNSSRVLFLVDRLELETQAYTNFVRYLKNDFTCVIYKQNKDTWKKAEIVISTVQSLLSQDKYKRIFVPTDFDLIISDESHRSIGGNARAVFEYFVGYKLGLTATPKNYLKNIDVTKLSSQDPRAWEKRQLLDTYNTFGCNNQEPTFRFGLIEGVPDYLVNPIVVDARTDITTQLLSDKGYSVLITDNTELDNDIIEGKEIKIAEGENQKGSFDNEEQTFFSRHYEKRFFSQKTNLVFCKTFIENAIKDPITNEIGKSIIFCVSQNHAAKITKTLNELAFKLWPSKYNSDFAVQVTSRIDNAQQFTTNFSNNNLNGHTKFIENYKSSKTRVCVTVGMMTTGYDCQDILNLGLMRPIFSPTDFIQIKGRGTRKFNFEYRDENNFYHQHEKINFKLFDFFANCEYFEEKFDYDEVLKLPKISNGCSGPGIDGIDIAEIEIFDPDKVKLLTEIAVGLKGMRIDREFFEKAKETIKKDLDVKKAVDNDQWDRAVEILRNRYEDRPDLYLNLDKIRRSENLDRRVTWREFLERVFGFIKVFKSKDEKLEDECEKFISIYKPESKYIPYIKNYLKAYVCDEEFRQIINQKNYGELNFSLSFNLKDFKALNGWRDIVPEYIKNYISLNTYVA